MYLRESICGYKRRSTPFHSRPLLKIITIKFLTYHENLTNKYIPLIKVLLFTDVVIHIYRFIQSVTERCRVPHTKTGKKNILINVHPEIFNLLFIAERILSWPMQLSFISAVLCEMFSVSPDRWTGREGPIQWPPRSQDLNPLDCYRCGHLKPLVRAAPVDNEETLHHSFVDACQTNRI
jgi:hypothetical protein